jgi:hypothetical protein
MSEITQIVRRMRDGESLPVYSTAELLMSMSVVSPKKVGSSAYDMSRTEKALVFKENYELIKLMLIRCETNNEISRAIGVPPRYLKDHIRSTDELIQLADARIVEICRKGGAVGVKKSRDRFAKQKDEILHALKTDALYKVSIQFKFSQRTLRNYVKEAREGL